jgi:hypothetical protein
MQHNFDDLLAADTSPLDASDALISVLIVLFRKLRENEVLSGIQIAEVLRTAGQGHAFAAAQLKVPPGVTNGDISDEKRRHERVAELVRWISNASSGAPARIAD